jgi:hypothetical protein
MDEKGLRLYLQELRRLPLVRGSARLPKASRSPENGGGRL